VNWKKICHSAGGADVNLGDLKYHQNQNKHLLVIFYHTLGMDKIVHDTKF